MGTCIDTLRIWNDASFAVYSVKVRNRWWERGKKFYTLDDGKTWHGEIQEIVTLKVLLHPEASYENDEAIKVAARFLSKARNRAKLLLGQEILSRESVSGRDNFDVAVVRIGYSNHCAFLPSEWQEVLSWNRLPDPELAVKQITNSIYRGEFEAAAAVELLEKSKQKVDALPELSKRLLHPRRYQPGFNSKNYATKKPYKSKPSDEDYRPPNDPWDEDK